MHTSASPRVKNTSTNQIQIALTSREATEPSHSGLRRDGADQPVKAVGADAAHREVLRQAAAGAPMAHGRGAPKTRMQPWCDQSDLLSLEKQYSYRSCAYVHIQCPYPAGAPTKAIAPTSNAE